MASYTCTKLMLVFARDKDCFIVGWYVLKGGEGFFSSPIIFCFCNVINRRRQQLETALRGEGGEGHAGEVRAKQIRLPGCRLSFQGEVYYH